MEWITVIAFLVVGIGLIVVEIIFVPGTTIVGILGAGLAVVGIILSFNLFGRSTGWITFGVSGAVATGLIYWSLRSKAWARFSLKDTIDSRVNEGAFAHLQTGQEGVTVSTLRPVGKADFNGKMHEVTTPGNYVESGKKIRIIKISSNQILVEPVN